MAVNEKSLKNIIPPQKGEVRNPKGKPKGTPNSKTVIAKWLNSIESTENPLTQLPGKLSQLDIIVLQQILKARKGDTTAFNALLDRMEGKAMKHVEHGGKDGGPIDLSVANLPNIPTEDLIRYLSEQ